MKINSKKTLAAATALCLLTSSPVFAAQGDYLRLGPSGEKSYAMPANKAILIDDVRKKVEDDTFYKELADGKYINPVVERENQMKKLAAILAKQGLMGPGKQEEAKKYLKENIAVVQEALLKATEETPKIERPSASLKVASVSAITKTSVDVKFEALKEDKKDVMLVVLNDKKESVEMLPKNLLVGESQAKFFFKTALKEDPTGVWTVSEMTVDLDEMKLIKEVKDAADNQVKLEAALTKLGDKLQNIVEANYPLYAKANKEATAYTSVADIQKMIDKANEKAVLEQEEQEAAEKVVEAWKAKNAIALKKALAHKVFKRVNSEWLSVAGDGYVEKLQATDDTVAEIQTKIDASNTALLVEGTFFEDNSKKMIAEHQAKALKAAEDYGTRDDKDQLTGAAKTLAEKVKTYQALLNLKNSTSGSDIKNNLEALKQIAAYKELDMKKFIVANAEGYIATFNASGAGIKHDSDKDAVEAMLTSVNDGVSANVIKALTEEAENGSVSEDSLLAAMKKVEGLERIVDDYKDQYFTSKNDYKNSAIGTLEKAQAQVDKDNVTKILALINSASSADDLLPVLQKAKELYPKEIKAEIVEAFKADYHGAKAQLTTDLKTVNAKLEELNKKGNEKLAVEAIKAAETAEAIKMELDKLHNLESIEKYGDVYSSDQLFIAKGILNHAEKNQFDAITGGSHNLQAAITAVVGSYSNALEQLNQSTKATVKSQIATQLKALGIGGEDATPSQLSALAEKFLQNAPFSTDVPGHPVPPFMNIGEVEACLNK